MYTPSKSLHGLLDGIIKLSVKQNKYPLAARGYRPYIYQYDLNGSKATGFRSVLQLIFWQLKVSKLTSAAAADITIIPRDDLIRIAIRTAIHYAALH